MKDEAISKVVKFVGVGILLAVVAWSFYITGSPELNRELRTDQHRIRDVHTAKEAVDIFFKLKKTLPESMEIMFGEAVQHSYRDYKYDSDEYKFASRMDSLLSASKHKFFNIEYKVTGEFSYNLCTTFFHPWDKRKAYRNYWENKHDTKWHHPSGNHCFGFTVTPAE